ncbi:MAG: Long-chain-fatty-acid--CoA ligase [Alphaproteobacteria bacterium MarineAlpha1_Bin1]|nr:MAG: Long-chain-fatty-acid--CoA ligase [Alphaproteobacteria bacterium MarineAlpha1_Bin1]
MTGELLVRTLADVEAIEANPLSHLNLPQSTYHAIKDAATTYPNRIAFKKLLTGSAEEQPQILLYRDLIAKIHQTANLLHELNVGKDDAVTLLLPIIPETSICLWAAAANGIANPVNSFLETDHLVAIMRSGKAKVVIGCHPSIESTSWPRVQAIREQIPDLITIQLGGEGKDLDPGVIHFETAISMQPDDRLVSGREPQGHDTCAYLHTGGTTGAPKLARHHHQAQLLQCAGLDFLLGPQDPSIGLLGIPMFHVGGAIVSSLYALSRGGTIITLHPNGLRDPVTVRDFLANAARFNATTLGGVPASWAALLTLPSDHLDLHTVRNGIVGASTLPLEVANGVAEKFGFPLIEGWGMTETHGFATMNPLHGENRVGSVGVRLPYLQIKIAQLDENGHSVRECDTDEIGVILIKGPQVITGYVEDAHNQDAWVENDWLNTGDLARMDADGYIWHTGRAKDLIIRGGHNIDPVLIEEILYQAPGVELAAAVGQPDRRVGEVPVAFVQMQPGKTFDEEAIKAFVRDHIQERAANPVAVHSLNEMPLTQVGKIFKPSLRMEAARIFLQRELSAVAADRGHIAVSVDAHPNYGTLATISITGGDEDLVSIINDAVGGYPLRTAIVRS